MELMGKDLLEVARWEVLTALMCNQVVAEAARGQSVEMEPAVQLEQAAPGLRAQSPALHFRLVAVAAVASEIQGVQALAELAAAVLVV